MSEKGKKNKKKTGLGLAIWILAFLIILIVFLVKQEEIRENFDKSGASALIEKKIGKDVFEKKESQNESETGETVIELNLKKNTPVAKKEEKKQEAEAKTQKTETPTQKTEPQKSEKTETTPKNSEKTEKAPAAAQKTQTVAQNQKTEEKKQESNTQQTKPSTDTKAVAQTQPSAQSKTAQPAQTASTPVPVSNTIKAKICFVAIDSDGPVVRKEVSRSVAKDSPMGDALKMLLAGPSATEAKTGCRSLIPEGTRLLSARVQNGVATLNFSEEFQFNQFGAEGSLAQLMQVVYTATNFSTVKSVQILIEGQKRDYLTEGVWIGSPLSRNSF